MIHADFGFPAPYDKNSRIFNINLAGGSLLDIGIYPLFLSLLVLGEPKEIKALAQIGETGIDESLVISLLYENGAIAVLSSTFMVKTTTRADIFGVKGRIGLKPRWISQTSLELEMHDGGIEEFTFNYRSNGYDYEAEEVMQCLDSGLTESQKLPLDFSLKLMTTMDQIRKQIGLQYPEDNF
jgi:predicted dehydrogenase